MEKKSIFIFKNFRKAITCMLSVITVFAVYFCTQTPLFYGYGDTFEISTLSSSSNAIFYNVNESQYRFSFNRTGESCEIFTEEISVDKILADFSAKIVFIEETAQQTSYYAYSDKIKYLKILDGKKVNLHISTSNEKTKIGSPIIFGSF